MALTLKPFDKTAALAGDPCCTVTGLLVTQLSEKTDAYIFTLSGVLNNRIMTWDENGLSSVSSDYNLFMKEAAVEGWINIYWDDTNLSTSVEVFATEELAILGISEPEIYVKTIMIDNSIPE